VIFLAAGGLIMLLSGLGAYYTTGELGAFSLINVTAGPALLIAAGVVQTRQVRGFSGALSRRVALIWGGTALGVSLAAALLTTLTNGWSATIDLTALRSYTLAPQTHEVCAHIPPPGDARAVELLFFEEAKLAGEVDLLVRAYQAACPQLRVRFLTAAEAPAAARMLLDRVEATLVACQGVRCEHVGFPAEENITNALLRLSRRGTLAAYFLIGHGEVDLADEGDDGYSGLAAVLRAEGIEPRGWIGPASGTVPERADVVIIAAPERNLLAPEIEALDLYLREGGRLLALLEPGVRTNVDDLLERWGFRLEPGVLADQLTSPLIEDPSPISLLVHSFGQHDVVRDLDVRTMLLLPGARPVDAARKPEPADQMRNIAYTSPGGWLETDVDAALADLPIEPDAHERAGQRLPLAATGRYPRGEREARIVVVGDRDFVSNRMLASLYNRDLFMNAIWWLAEDERWVTIRPKLWTPDHYPVTIEETLSYFYFFAFALPEALLLLGIAAWYRQRG
jgi:hypothetical protein